MGLFGVRKEDLEFFQLVSLKPTNNRYIDTLIGSRLARAGALAEFGKTIFGQKISLVEVASLY